MRSGESILGAIMRRRPLRIREPADYRYNALWTLHGWTLRLFPYLPCSNRSPVRNLLAERDPGSGDGVKISDFATGISKTDFLLIDFRNCPPDTFPMEFMAGFVGIHQDSSTLALRPEVGWIDRDDPDKMLAE